nr:uncharacterized protein LOC129260680 [Lytechinus pictus]
MMQYRTILLLYTVLAYYKVNGTQPGESRCKDSAVARYYLDAKREPIDVLHDIDDEDCWMIHGPDDHRVRIKFSSFSLTAGYDFLTIGDLSDDIISSNSLLAEFSGGNLPEDVVSPSEGIWMELTTQKHVSSHRTPNIMFSIQIEKRKVDINLPCPNESPMQKLTYPLTNVTYSSNGYRLWNVATQPPCSISTMMTSLWLEGGHDFVFLGDDIRNPFSRLKWLNFTGEKTQEFLSQYSYQTYGNSITIIFTSDYSRENPGFTLKLQVVEPSQTSTIEVSTEYKTPVYLSSPQLIEIMYQGQSKDTKFYLIVICINVATFAALALLFIFVARCMLSKFNDRTSPRPPSVSARNSFGWLFDNFRHNADSSLPRIFSSGSESSGRSSFTISSFRSYKSSSNTTSGMSSIYASLSSQRNSDSLPGSRLTLPEKHQTTFTPAISQDTSVVVDVTEGTSGSKSEGDGRPRSRPITWRMIRNAFWSGSIRNSAASSVRSASIQERDTRWSRCSTSSDDLQESGSVNSMNVRSSAIPTNEAVAALWVTKRNSSRPGDEDGTIETERMRDYPRNQQEIPFAEREDGLQMKQHAERRMTHTYFKCFNQSDSSSKLPSASSNRPLPSIPYRRRISSTEHDANLRSLSGTTDPEEQELYQDVEKKVTHNYFKGFNRSSTSSELPNDAGKQTFTSISTQT